MIYRFTSESRFIKLKNSELAMFANDDTKAMYFATIPGIPNPWFVHPVKNGKIDKTKVYKYTDLKKKLKKFFK